MTSSLSIRLTSFALSVIVTVSILAGLEALVPQQHAGATQMSHSSAAKPA